MNTLWKLFFGRSLPASFIRYRLVTMEARVTSSIGRFTPFSKFFLEIVCAGFLAAAICLRSVVLEHNLWPIRENLQHPLRTVATCNPAAVSA